VNKGKSSYKSLKSKILWLIIVFIVILSLLLAKKAIAPQKVEASQPTRVMVSMSPVEECLTESCILDLVKKEFQDIPILIKIAKCESQNRQFDKNGEVLRGVQNPLDRGLFQINEYYHLEASKRLGMDIYTLKGNMDYARYLYEQSGTSSWEASEYCWNV
jgi:hypothetical protein